MALFDTPQDVLARERADRANQGSSAFLHEAASNFGRQGALALGRKFFDSQTTESQRSPEERTAANIQKLIKGLDLTNRESIGTVANKLQQGGHMAEAAQLLQLMPASVDSFGPVTPQTTNIVNPDGTLKSVRQNFQAKNDGSVKSVGAAVTTDRITSGGQGSPPKLNTGLWAGFGVKDNMKEFIQLNLLNGASDSFLQGSSEEDLFGAVGKIEVFASRIKADKWRDVVSRGYTLFPQDETQANRWINAQRPPDDQVIAQEALNLIKESGGMEDFVKFNDFLNNQVEIATESDTTPAEALERKARIDSDKAFSLENDKLVSAIVRGDVTEGELNLKDVNLTDGLEAFRDFETKSFEQISEGFRSQGIEVGSQEALQSHVQHWAWMKQQPLFTKSWMAATNDRERRNIFSDVTTKLVDEDRMQEFWQITRVNNYLSRMKTRSQTKTGIQSRFKTN